MGEILEMERDGLLAHGIAVMMKQIFMHHSDGDSFMVCTNLVNSIPCGTICYQYDTDEHGNPIHICAECKSCLHAEEVPMPYCFKSLVQLCAGAKIKFRIVV